MQRIIALSACCIVAFASVACSSSPVERQATPHVPVVEKKELKTTAIPLGWVDDNTFRVRAGSDIGGMRGDNDRTIKEAKNAAILKAQDTIIEKFIRDRVKSAEKIIDPKSTGVAIINEFGSIVKKGTVRDESYDAPYKCGIIYEISSPDLKKRVRTTRN